MISAKRLAQSFARLALFAALTVVFGEIIAASNHFADAQALQGRAILAAEGRVGIGAFTSIYPPVPILLATIMQWAIGWTGIPASLAAPAILAGALGTHWANRIWAGGYGLGWVLILPLIIFHPLFLLAVTDGSGTILLLAFVYVYAHALYALRGHSRARDAIAAGLALASLPMCDAMGFALAAIILPLSLLAAPPRLLRRSAMGVALILAFPSLFALASFAALCGVFGAADWSMINPLASGQLLASDTTLPLRGAAEPLRWGALWLEAAAFLIGVMPAAAVLAYSVRRRPPLLEPGLALLAAAPCAVMVALGLGWRTSLEDAMAPILGLLVAMILWRTRRSFPTFRLAAWLVLGLVSGGIFTAATLLPRFAEASPSEVSMDRDAYLTGQALAGIDDVMVDTDASPEIVAARGTARGLVTVSDASFRLALMHHQIPTHYVLVANPDAQRSHADAISLSFPKLYADGAPGMRLVYDTPTWRIYRVQTHHQK